MWKNACYFCYLGLLVAGLAACSKGAEDYQRDLEKRGVPYTEEAFLESAAAGDADALGIFLDAGMDPNVRDDKGMTALILGAMKGHVDIVSTLLERGARPNIEDEGGRTALDFASADPGNGVFGVLVSSGAIYGSLGE